MSNHSWRGASRRRMFAQSYFFRQILYGTGFAETWVGWRRRIDKLKAAESLVDKLTFMGWGLSKQVGREGGGCVKFIGKRHQGTGFAETWEGWRRKIDNQSHQY